MSLITGILPASNVLTGITVASKKRALEVVAKELEPGTGLAPSTVFDSLFAREKLGSTGLGEGIAIPHGRIRGLKEAMGAFVKLATPVPFDAPDGQPVDMLFILLVPEQANDLHLQILGELAQLFSDEDMRNTLRETSEPEDLFRLLTGWSP